MCKVKELGKDGNALGGSGIAYSRHSRALGVGTTVDYGDPYLNSQLSHLLEHVI